MTRANRQHGRKGVNENKSTKNQKDCGKNKVNPTINEKSDDPIAEITPVQFSYEDFRKFMDENLVGQEPAKQQISEWLTHKFTLRIDEPIVFYFVGPSGVGKTELAKLLAKYIYNSDSAKNNFTRIDMGEYPSGEHVNKLLGAPPGYVSCERPGRLAEAIKKSMPIVLFDEIEKAHLDVTNVLFSALDEGLSTDNKGATVASSDAIFIMTSNLASDEIAKYSKENRLDNISNAFYDKVTQIFAKHFQRTEFLGRINKFVYFGPFTSKDYDQLVKNVLNDQANDYHKKFNLSITWEDDVIPLIKKVFNVKFGVRHIKNTVIDLICTKISVALNVKKIKNGDSIRVVTDDSSGHNGNDGFPPKFKLLKGVKPPFIQI